MKVEQLVPEVYYKESRDFSYIGRILEIALNYMKTSADSMNTSYNDVNIDSNLLDLFATTLGFELKHHHPTKDLVYALSSFSELVRTKGTKQSIVKAIQLLATCKQINADISISNNILIDANDRYNWTIIIPQDMSVEDIVLLEDLFEYIMPTGIVYELSRGQSSGPTSTTNSITINQNIVNCKKEDKYLSNVTTDYSTVDLVGEDDSSTTSLSTFYTNVVYKEE